MSLSADQLQNFKDTFTNFAQENPDQAFNSLKEIFDSHMHGPFKKDLVSLSTPIAEAYKKQSDISPFIDAPLYQVYKWQYSNSNKTDPIAQQAVAGMKPFILAEVDTLVEKKTQDATEEAESILHNFSSWSRKVNDNVPDQDATDKMGVVIGNFITHHAILSHESAFKRIKERDEAILDLKYHNPSFDTSAMHYDNVQKMGDLMLAAAPEKGTDQKRTLSRYHLEDGLFWMKNRLPEDDTTVDAIETTIFDRLGFVKPAQEAGPTEAEIEAEKQRNLTEKTKNQIGLIEKFMQNYGGGSVSGTQCQLSLHI
jgi:hypothetical protein